MDEHNTIIIGAGPAGLAVGACLKKVGVPLLILEQSEKVGSVWRNHYDRLHLHTDKGNSGLPYMKFGKDVPRYASRLQVVEYLERYAQTFGLLPRFGQRVVRAARENGEWVVETQDGRYQSKNLVVASGYTRECIIPDWPGKVQFQGDIFHSSEYKNGAAYKGKEALVVGFGNSGGEIAVDLWEHGARPALSVRSPVNVIPRDILGVPFLRFAILQNKLPAWVADLLNAPTMRLKIGDLTRYGLPKLPYGPATQVRKDRRIPLIDVGTVRLIKEGKLKIYRGIKSFTQKGVVFTDGQEQNFDVVVLATGYRPRVNQFLEGGSAVLDEHGTPLKSGRTTSMPGLYFCGFYVSPTGMLREIGIEARRIAGIIAGN